MSMVFDGTRRLARSGGLAIALTALAAGCDPAQGQEYLYVQNSRGGDITVISIPRHEIVGTIPASKVGKVPDDVVPSTDGTKLFIPRIEGEDVLVISTETEEVLYTVPVGGTPHHVTVSRDDRFLYVPIFNDAFVEVIDLEQRKVVARVPVGYGPHGTILSADGKRVYVGNILSERMAVIEVGTHRLVKGIEMPEGVRPFQVARDEKKLWAQISKMHGFVEVDLATDRVTKTIHLPTLGKTVPVEAYAAFPHTIGHGMWLTGDGKLLFVAATLYDFAAVYSVPTMDLVATIPTGKEPGWMACNRSSTYCYTSNRGDNTLSVISVAEKKEIKRLDVGNFPQRMNTALVPRRAVRSDR